MLDARADLGQNIANLVREPGVRGIPARAAGRAGTRHPRAGHRAVATANPRRPGRRSCCSHAMLRRPSVDAMRRDFVANVSHELRTPLTVLVGFLETVRELKLNPQRQRDYLAMMQEQAARMQRIIDDLLTLSALDAAPPASSDRRVPVRPLLERLKADAEALSGGAHDQAKAGQAKRLARCRQRARERLRQHGEQRHPLYAAGRHGHLLPGAKASMARASASRTPASASSPSTSRGSPSVSTGSIAAARARPAAPASASRSGSTRLRATMPSSRSRASWARGAASPPVFRAAAGRAGSDELGRMQLRHRDREPLHSLVAEVHLNARLGALTLGVDDDPGPNFGCSTFWPMRKPPTSLTDERGSVVRVWLEKVRRKRLARKARREPFEQLLRNSSRKRDGMLYRVWPCSMRVWACER